MKKLKLVVIFFINCLMLYGCASVSTDMKIASEESMHIESVQNINNLSKLEIFKRANIWIAQNFNSANDVIQYRDEEKGVIVCKGSIAAYRDIGGLAGNVNFGDISYTLTIDIKDNKIRTTFDHFSMKYKSNSQAMTPLQQDVDEMKPKLIAISNNLHKYINNPDSKSW